MKMNNLDTKRDTFCKPRDVRHSRGDRNLWSCIAVTGNYNCTCKGITILHFKRQFNHNATTVHIVTIDVN